MALFESDSTSINEHDLRQFEKEVKEWIKMTRQHLEPPQPPPNSSNKEVSPQDLQTRLLHPKTLRPIPPPPPESTLSPPTDNPNPNSNSNSNPLFTTSTRPISGTTFRSSSAHPPTTGSPLLRRRLLYLSMPPRSLLDPGYTGSVHRRSPRLPTALRHSLSADFLEAMAFPPVFSAFRCRSILFLHFPPAMPPLRAQSRLTCCSSTHPLTLPIPRETQPFFSR
ncbi:hypothetical protein V2J09_021981 [Rumex salicifolius]